MDFIQHSINWAKGEILEAVLFGVFGFLVMIIAIMFWKIGSTPNVKAIVIPLLVVGLFFAGMGVFGVYKNQNRITVYTKEFKTNPTEFVKKEKERVETFKMMYKTTVITFAVLSLFAFFVFVFSCNNTLKSIGIALAIFGLTILIIDYFSEERAAIYYEKIIDEIETTTHKFN